GRDLLSLREYQPQDEPRHIDWKATARTQQLTVREFAAEDEKRVSIILDTDMGEKAVETTSVRERLAVEQSGVSVVASEQYERIASLAASLLSHFSLENAEFRLIIDGDAGEFGNGRPHLYDSLRRLALTEPKFPSKTAPPEPDPDIERILNESDDSHRFFVTANGGRGLSAEALQRLKIIGV
ncbi:MAG: DUF58 domain-containing protein, partial [Pyrinomonadaceae bacterium]